ncbi:MAG: hypothetical protein JSW07_00635 [bacterium]|nr:MAG: hypothetical protein JSW07_00635 [bacterium]
MKIEEILKQYHNEWLLIEFEKFDEDYKPIEGKVLTHSPIESVILDALAKCESDNIALEYTGEIPEDVGVLL